MPNKYGNEIRFYVAYFKDSNKKDIRFKELLSHYARLQPWIPFYNTIDRKVIQKLL
jgi:hypothetical protein